MSEPLTSPRRALPRAAMCRLAIAAFTLFAPLARAEEIVPPAPVDAVEQPGSARVVERLEPGRRYTVSKHGGPGRAWCRLDLASGRGWILCPTVAPTPSTAKTSDAAPTAPDPFDYYVLSLSWSPTFCEEHPGAGGDEQCRGARPYGFVVHGLWPQRERGWPESCSSAPGPDAALAGELLSVMPSRRLIAHEWQKHGTCSGLDAPRYFALLRRAFERVAIPADLRSPTAPVVTDLAGIQRRFVAANAGLTPEMFAVRCRGRVSEIEICLDKELRFRRCGGDVADRCRGPATFPATRGH